MPGQRKPRADGRTHPRGDRARGRVARDGRRPRRALDRQPRRRARHEQERHLRPLRLETRSPTRHRRRSRRIFEAEVIEPALDAAPGLAQLVALCDAFFDHLMRRTFPGGCFFAGAVLEMGTRPGPVKEQIAAFQSGFSALIREFVVTALEQHETPRRRGPRRTHLRTERRSSSPPTPTSSCDGDPAVLVKAKTHRPPTTGNHQHRIVLTQRQRHPVDPFRHGLTTSRSHIRPSIRASLTHRSLLAGESRDGEEG